MDEAKKARILAKGQFTRAEKKTVKLFNSVNISSVWALEQQYGELKARWKSVETAHDEFVSLIEDENTAEGEEDWLEEISERFDELELKISSKIQGFTRHEDVQKNEQSTSQVGEPTQVQSIATGNRLVLPNMVKVEKLKFRIFGGDIRKYPEFRAEFVKHLEPQCNPGQLPIVLKGYLSDSVLEEVSHCSDDYDTMWARLDQKYGNTRMLLYAILEQVKHLKCSGNGPDETLKMISIVEKAWRDLEKLGETTELCNAQTISTIEQAMSEQMQNEWVKEIASKRLNSTLKFNKALLTFLADWRCRIEYMGCGIRTAGEEYDSPQGGSYHTGGQTGFKPASGNRCWLHDNLDDDGAPIHSIWRCQLFRSKSVSERRNLTLLNKACQRCLETACSGAKDIEKCQRGFKCSVSGCGGNHNRLLHMTDGTVNHASGLLEM